MASLHLDLLPKSPKTASLTFSFTCSLTVHVITRQVISSFYGSTFLRGMEQEDKRGRAGTVGEREEGNGRDQKVPRDYVHEDITSITVPRIIQY